MPQKMAVVIAGRNPAVTRMPRFTITYGIRCAKKPSRRATACARFLQRALFGRQRALVLLQLVARLVERPLRDLFARGSQLVAELAAHVAAPMAFLAAARSSQPSRLFRPPRMSRRRTCPTRRARAVPR